MRTTRRDVLLTVVAALSAACSPGRSSPPPPTSAPAVTLASAVTPVPAGTPASAVTSAPSPVPTPTGAPTMPPESGRTPTLAPTPRPVATSTATPAPTDVLPGVDVLMRDRLDLLKGRRLGLVTNATGRSRDGQSTIDVLRAAAAWRLVALFSPEHGIRGQAPAGQSVASSVDDQTGLPVYSLYGETTRPTDRMLEDLDALVFDIQDAGARPFTYPSTLLEVLRAAAKAGLPVIVLDRPNPIGGEQVEGNVLDPRFASFVGPAAIAMRHGLTIGELGRLFNTELGVGAELTVVPLHGWRRAMWFDQTGLSWVNPSPNLRSVSALALYPGTVLFEGTSLSEGRGTERPFEWIGAPWIDAAAWAERLNARGLPGVRFTPSDQTPESSKFAGQLCHGVSIEMLEREELRAMELSVTMIAAARAIAGSRVQLAASTFDGLAGTDRLRLAIQADTPVDEIVAGWEPDLQHYRARRARALLY